MTTTQSGTEPVGHYGQWFRAWVNASQNPALERQPDGARYDDLTLASLHNELVEMVATRVDRALSGDPGFLPIGPEDSMEEQAIAAELEPVIDRLHQLGLVDRILSSAEQSLLSSTSNGDRPAIRALTELGQEVAETVEAGQDPLHELGFHPMAYLPTEVLVISRAANLDLYHLNHPRRS
mgnify:CR=1 FL=1